MKKFFIKILLRYLKCLGWSEFNIPVQVLNKTDLKRIELQCEVAIPCLYPVPYREMYENRRRISYGFAQELYDMIERNMIIESVEDRGMRRTMVRARVEIYVKNK